MKVVIFVLVLAFGLVNGDVHPSGYVSDQVKDPIAELTDAIRERAPFRSVDAVMYSGIRKDACWKETYGRGVGKPIHACPDGQDKDAGLCYKPCKNGYKGVGPVCWQHCKSDYTDTGAFCTKGGKIISANNKKCPWYDKCGLTFSKGCSTCPDHDPKYHNDGCTCRYNPHTYAKDTYGRGVGKPLGCSKDEEYDAGLCYKPCRANYNGVGPVCWHKCPGSLPADSGAVCCQNKDVCSQFIKEVSISTLTAVAAAIEVGVNQAAAIDAVVKSIEAALGFVLYNCGRYP